MMNIPLISTIHTIIGQTTHIGQKVEEIVSHINKHASHDPACSILSGPHDVIKTYGDLISETTYRYAISDIDQWLSIDHIALQTFRQQLDTHAISTRIICKYKGIRHEPVGLKNREIKILSPHYLLISNIDIVGRDSIVITNPSFPYAGLHIRHQALHDMLLDFFNQFWNTDEHIVGIQPGDTQSTASRISVMKSGKNYGIDYVINPVLYPTIAQHLSKPHTQIIDCGSGINTLGQELLYGSPYTIPGLYSISDLTQKRGLIQVLTGFEANQEFVSIAMATQQAYETNDLRIVRQELIAGHHLPYQDNSIDMAISRNFIVHLSYDDLQYHFAEVYRVLRPGGYYILATLNPAYEYKKYLTLTGSHLCDGQRYNHYHGQSGERGTRVQYYKSRQKLEQCFVSQFSGYDVQVCLPINDDAKQHRPEYYDTDCPMGLVYTIVK